MYICILKLVTQHKNKTELINGVIDTEIEAIPSTPYSGNINDTEVSKATTSHTYKQVKNVQSPHTNTHLTTLIFPKFKNTDNDCWFNSALQVIIHILNNRGEGVDLIQLTQGNDDAPLANALLDSIISFSKPGEHHVGSYKVKDPTVAHGSKVSLKTLMLKAMGVISPNEQRRQHDAAECLQALLQNVPSLFSFLCHQLSLKSICIGCLDTTQNDDYMAIVLIEMTEFVEMTSTNKITDKNETFPAKDAIIRYFKSKETAVERNCEKCPALACSREITLGSAANFIIVQFKRFKDITSTSPNTRNKKREFEKIYSQFETFSAVDIETSQQGVKKYEVFATIEHIGDYNNGHYVSYLLHNKIWYCCNDLSITQLQKEDEHPTKNMYICILKLVHQ